MIAEMGRTCRTCGRHFEKFPRVAADFRTKGDFFRFLYCISSEIGVAFMFFESDLPH
jgi:hypothetical protein